MKKVLSLVLALAMVLGSFSFVSAADFTDVTDATLAKAVDRLALLEVLTGYPDGSFKPEQTITRAEFAAVAVRAKGLEDAANAAKGLATGFTDVAAGNWAAGYVGTAGKLGIVNGVGNGLFAPNAPVKYEEAVTMMVRALGYEVSAQTKGGYPYGYLIVANEIGLLDDVKGTQGMPASRGIVAQIADNALEIPKMIQVGFGSDAKWVVSGSKEHGDEAEAQLLLHDLGVDEIKGKVTNNFRTKSSVKAGEIEISDYLGRNPVKYDIAEGVDTDAVLGTGVTAWAKDDTVFSISLGYKIKTSAGKNIVFNESQVIYDAIVNNDNQTTLSEAYLKVLDDEYDWADDATVYVNNSSVREADLDEIEHRAYGRFVLNDDDEIEFAYLFDMDAADSGIVSAIDADDLEYVNLNSNDDVLALDDAEEIYVFNKDLSAAKLDDIKEDTAVFYWIDGDDNYHIVISNETLEGTLEAIRVRDSRITVAGKNITKAINAIYSLDNKDEFDVLDSFGDLEDYVDDEVVVHYDLLGDALAVVTDTEATTSTVYGIATWITSQRSPVLSVYTSEGKEVEYTFEETDEIPAAWRTSSFQFGISNITGVSFKVNKDGEIKEETFRYSQDVADFAKDADDKYGYFDGDTAEKLYITEKTVVLKALKDGKLKPSVIKYENIINKDIVLADNNDAVILRVKAGESDLGLLIFTDSAFQATDDAEFGIITSDPVVRGSSYRAEIDVYGKGKETYTISKSVNDLNLRTGDMFEFKLNDKGEVVSPAKVSKLRTDIKVPALNEEVIAKSGNYITLENSGRVRVTSDTVFYSATKSAGFGSSSSYGRIEVGDYVLVLLDGTDLKVAVETTLYVADTVSPLQAAQNAVSALFTTPAKTALKAGVTQTTINAAKAKVNVLPADVAPATTKADLLADIATAQGLLDVANAGAADQAMVNAELAKVPTTLELAVGATVSQAEVEAAVEELVDLNKVTVSASAAAPWVVTLTSKAGAGTANKTVTVTVAVAADEATVNVELAKVEDFTLPSGSVATLAAIKTAVEAKVDLNKVTVAVTQDTGNDFDVVLTAKVGSYSNPAKTITVSSADVNAAKGLVPTTIASVTVAGGDTAAAGDKEAAVAAHVNGLTGMSATGATATVDSGTTYDVVVTKGLISETVTVTVTLFVAP